MNEKWVEETINGILNGSKFPKGSKETWGVVKVGDGINVDDNGVISSGRVLEVSVIQPEHGTITLSVPCVLKGGTITATITAGDNYHLADVLVDGESVGAVGTYVFENIDRDHTIGAEFAENPIITVETPEHGTISPSTTHVSFGGSQTFAFAGDEGYAVDKIYVDGVEQEFSGETFTLENVTADHYLRATFALIPVYTFAIDGSIADPVACISYSGLIATMTQAERKELAYSFVRPSVVKSDGEVNYWLNPENLDQKLDGTASKLDGTDGDVCATFSPLWWTVSKSGDVITINAAKRKFSNSAICSTKFNGTFRKYNHLGMFAASTNGCASKWAAATANASLKTYRTTTQARNTNASGEKLLSPMTYLTRTMYQILYILAYGSLNSQTAVGKGVCDKASGSGTHTEAPVAAMKTCGGHFGIGSTGYTDNGSTPIMALWVMDGTGGDIWVFCDGCIYRDGNFALATDQSDMWNIELGWNNKPATWEVFAGLPAGASASYITKFTGDSAAPFFPLAASGGDSSKYACDACWSSSGEDKCCFVGAAWTVGAGCGAFALHVNSVASTSSRALGARLQILSPV